MSIIFGYFVNIKVTKHGIIDCTVTYSLLFGKDEKECGSIVYNCHWSNCSVNYDIPCEECYKILHGIFTSTEYYKLKFPPLNRNFIQYILNDHKLQDLCIHYIQENKDKFKKESIQAIHKNIRENFIDRSWKKLYQHSVHAETEKVLTESLSNVNFNISESKTGITYKFSI